MGLCRSRLLYNNILLFQDGKCPAAKYRTKLKSQILILGSRVDNISFGENLIKSPLRLHVKLLRPIRFLMSDQLAANIDVAEHWTYFAKGDEPTFLEFQGFFCHGDALTEDVERMKVPWISKIRFLVTCDCKACSIGQDCFQTALEEIVADTWGADRCFKLLQKAQVKMCWG